MAYRLKKDGVMVSRLLGEVDMGAQGVMVRTQSIIAHEGEVFTDLNPNLVDLIEDGQLDDTWEAVEAPEDVEEVEPVDPEEAERLAAEAAQASIDRENEELAAQENQRVEAAQAQADAEAKAIADAAQVYDPDQHKIDDVLAYLATADDDEVARVKAAEAAGKDRTGIAQFTKEPAGS